MPEIKFNSGVQSFKLNDAVSVSFNPTDIVFAEQIIATMEKLESKQNEYLEKFKDVDDYSTILEASHKLNAEMREMIDNLFGVPVCAPLFGNASVYAPADGLPLWCNLCLAIIDVMDESIGKEKAATNPRIQKYIAKYKR